MARTDGTVASVTAGVSTQEAGLRAPGLAQEQLNFRSKRYNGLERRPSAEFITNMATSLGGYDEDTDIILPIDTDGLGEGWVLFRPGHSQDKIRAFSNEGVEYPVERGPNSDEYVDKMKPGSVRTAGFNDKLMVLNTEVIPALTSFTIPAITTSMIHIKTGLVATPVDGTVVQVTDINGAVQQVQIDMTVAEGTMLGTNDIARLIRADFDGFNNGAGVAGISVEYLGSTVLLVREDGDYCDVGVSGPLGKDFVAINGILQDLSDVPANAVIGEILTIRPDPSSEYGTYYLRAELPTEGDGETTTQAANTAPQGNFQVTSDYVFTINNAGVYTLPDGTRQTGITLANGELVPNAWPKIGEDWPDDPLANHLCLNMFTWLTVPPGSVATELLIGFWHVPGSMDPWVPSSVYIQDIVSERVVFQSTTMELVGENGYTGDGFRFKNPIINIGMSEGRNYRVIFDYNELPPLPEPPDTGDLASVVWVEEGQPGSLFAMHPKTLPHSLTAKETNGQVVWEWQRESWDQRRAGDQKTNPMPTFLNNRLTDISSFQSRLILTSGDTVYASRTEHPTMFHRTTATQVPSTETVAISSTAGQSDKLEHIIAHNRDLLIFGAGAQYKISGNVAFTPQTASITRTANYPTDLGLRPITLGDDALFGFSYGNNTGINRFVADSTSSQDKAMALTGHVEKYIPAGQKLMTSSVNQGLVVVGSGDSSDLYVMEYEFSDKPQVAWSKWSLFGKIRAMKMVDNRLYLAIQNGGSSQELGLFVIDTKDDQGDHNYLDKKFTATDVDKVIVAPAGYKFYGLGLSEPTVIQGAGCPDPKWPAVIEDYSSDDIHLKDSMGGGTVEVGVRFDSEYVPTRPFARDEAGLPRRTFPIKLKRYDISVFDSGYMRTDTVSPHYDMPSLEWPMRTMGDWQNVVGGIPNRTETVQIPFRHDAEHADLKISTDSHLPLNIAQLEWQGRYSTRGRRMR